jgi:hypothetical protein
MHKQTFALHVALMLAAICAAEDWARWGAAAELMADDVPSCAGYLGQAHLAEARREA